MGCGMRATSLCSFSFPSTLVSILPLFSPLSLLLPKESFIVITLLLPYVSPFTLLKFPKHPTLSLLNNIPLFYPLTAQNIITSNIFFASSHPFFFFITYLIFSIYIPLHTLRCIWPMLLSTLCVSLHLPRLKLLHHFLTTPIRNATAMIQGTVTKQSICV